MEELANNIISKWGSFGILIAFAAYIIYEKIKAGLCNSNKEYRSITRDTDIIISQTKESMAKVENAIHIITAKMDSLERNTESRINRIDDEVDELKVLVRTQSEKISNRFINSIEEFNNKERDKHNQRIMNQIQIGPMLHKIMSRYLDYINCDHIVLGAFHNGTSSLSGIPFCKFDIISEKFNPRRVHYDVEFAPMYKNVDILLHNRLPMILLQQEYIAFEIREGEECELAKIDEILYRRLLGRGIQRVAFNIVRDKNDIPIGFVGCIRYDLKEMNEGEIKKCTREIEEVYNKNLTE